MTASASGQGHDLERWRSHPRASCTLPRTSGIHRRSVQNGLDTITINLSMNARQVAEASSSHAANVRRRVRRKSQTLRLHSAPIWIVQRGSNERTTHVGSIAGPAVVSSWGDQVDRALRIACRSRRETDTAPRCQTFQANSFWNRLKSCANIVAMRSHDRPMSRYHSQARRSSRSSQCPR